MSLPELSLQLLYGHLAWAVVLAALLASCWPARVARTRPVLLALMAMAGVLCALPGQASAAYWLGLTFQWPSGLLTGLCAALLVQAWRGPAGAGVMTPALAVVLAVSGAVLYLDAIGQLPVGLYYRGFGAGAAALGLLLALLAFSAAIRARVPAQALPLLLALTLFSVWRLPTGNLWDALLDPLLWGWALVCLARLGWRRVRAAPDARAPT